MNSRGLSLGRSPCQVLRKRPWSVRVPALTLKTGADNATGHTQKAWRRGLSGARKENRAREGTGSVGPMGAVKIGRWGLASLGKRQVECHMNEGIESREQMEKWRQ